PLTCPESKSRKSLAVYYYTDGRPADPRNPEGRKVPTTFYARPGKNEEREIEHAPLWKKVVYQLEKKIGKKHR
ncbi:MAG: hypothetical protein AAFO69_14460, partial [Bacteroidota bacterium]